MSLMKALSLCALVTATGCGTVASPGEMDGSISVDAAMPLDLATPPDQRVVVVLADLMTQPDLATVPDLIPARDTAVPVWPFGKDGQLIVAAGTTTTLTNGAVLDYASCTLQAGATLVIEDGPYWTILGCAGDLTLQQGAKIVARNGLANAPQMTAAPDDKGNPAGETLTYPGNQPKGGDGGGGGQSGAAGLTAFGLGGGGGGGGAGNGGKGGDAMTAVAGAGGLPVNTGCTLVYSAPGAMGFTMAGLGSDGQNGVGTAINQNMGCGNDYIGGGGSGGFRGKNGGLLYMKVAGTMYGSGTIDLSGTSGGKGGTGGPTLATASSGPIFSSGCGGGGGAGGQGGKFVLRHKTRLDTIQILVGGGQAGGAGMPGAASGQSSVAGNGGAMGAAGGNGFIDAAPY